MRPTGRAEKVVTEAHPTSMTCNPGREPYRWCRNGSALEAEHRWWQHIGGRGDGRGGGIGEEHRRRRRFRTVRGEGERRAATSI
jgi:hypothetical protein